jgi:glycosyltransferase involved in cell wall biosynthesis
MFCSATKTILIIPCFNEYERLNTGKFLNFLKEHPTIGVCFVNDGSKDDTHQLLSNLKQVGGTQVEFVNLEINSGKAEAVRRGMLAALHCSSGEYFGYWDADLAAPLQELISFLDHFAFNPEIDVVMGSRIKKLGANIQRNWMRHYLGRVFATVIGLIFSFSVYDSQCGAKVFKRDIAKEVFETPFISRWLFDVELIYRCTLIKHKKVFLFECPLSEWCDIKGSKVNFFSYLRSVYDTLKLALHYKPWKK